MGKWHKFLLSADGGSPLSSDDIVAGATPGTFLKKTSSGLQWSTTTLGGETALSRLSLFGSNQREVQIKCLGRRDSLYTTYVENDGESTPVTFKAAQVANNSNQFFITSSEAGANKLKTMLGHRIVSVSSGSSNDANTDIFNNAIITDVGGWVSDKARATVTIKTIQSSSAPIQENATNVIFKVFNHAYALESDAIFQAYDNSGAIDHNFTSDRPVVIFGFGNDNINWNTSGSLILFSITDTSDTGGIDSNTPGFVARDQEDAYDASLALDVTSSNLQFIDGNVTNSGNEATAIGSDTDGDGSYFMEQLRSLSFEGLNGVTTNLEPDESSEGTGLNPTGNLRLVIDTPQDLQTNAAPTFEHVALTGRNVSVDDTALTITSQKKLFFKTSSTATALKPYIASTANAGELFLSSGTTSSTQSGKVIIGNDLEVSNKLTVTGDLEVQGTTTTVDSTTITIQNAFAFEGPTDNDTTTTLVATDPTTNQTITLPNLSGYIPLLAVDSTTQISSTPEELNLLDGVPGLVQADFTKLAAVNSTADELNLLYNVSGLVQADFTKLAAIDSTATELNIMDSDTTVGTTVIADGHGIVMNHAGTMAQTKVETLAAYLDDEITNMPNLVETGNLDDGSITSGFGAINIGDSNLTATGTISLGATSFNDENITNVGNISLDSISADGNSIDINMDDDEASAFTIKQGGNDYITINTTNDAEKITLNKDVEISENLTVSENLTLGEDKVLKVDFIDAAETTDSNKRIDLIESGGDAVYRFEDARFDLYSPSTSGSTSHDRVYLQTQNLLLNLSCSDDSDYGHGFVIGIGRGSSGQGQNLNFTHTGSNYYYKIQNENKLFEVLQSSEGDALGEDASGNAHAQPAKAAFYVPLTLSNQTHDTTDTSYTFPSARGSNNQVMVTDSNGVLSWADQASGGGSDLTIKEEGTALATAATSLNFTGNGVVASGTGADKTITITDTTYSSMGIGNSYAAGLTPVGSSTHGDTFLRKDGTWVTPPDTNTWVALTGTVSGYVTAEGSGDTAKFLNGNAAWSTPPNDNDNTTYSISAVDSGNDAIIRLTAGGSGSGDDDVKLVAGTDISLTPSGDNITIAYTGTTPKFFIKSAFYHGNNNLEYIPIAGGSTIEVPSPSGASLDDSNFIVPYDLKINTIYVTVSKKNATDDNAGNTNIRLHKNGSTYSANVTVDIDSVATSGSGLYDLHTFDFSSETNTYSAGDTMQISIDPTDALYYVNITIAGEYT